MTRPPQTKEEYIATLLNRAAEIMVEHEDWPVNYCMQVAAFEHAILYGEYEPEPPRGIIGVSPLGEPRQ